MTKKIIIDKASYSYQPAPVILFVYNRPEHTKKTIESLKCNELARQSELIIFSDGPKNVHDGNKVLQVRDIIHSTAGFKKTYIHERKQNLGLAESVITGINEVFKKYEKVIVLEDDMICSRDFLNFMNISSVSGYIYPNKIPRWYAYDVVLFPRASTWGWGTWRNRWEKADWEIRDFNDFMNNIDLRNMFNRGGNDLVNMLHSQIKGEIDSWGIRWSYTHFKERAYGLFPVKSKILNIGLDGTGIHSGSTERFDQKLHFHDNKYVFPGDIKPDKRMIEKVSDFFNK